ncbi:MAG: helix-turn-helix transcriptional regulator [Ruminococcaceae bacterium]|nr:helix-turn-helix transcriptional regulator [Oscillospiraceae bacterium]
MIMTETLGTRIAQRRKMLGLSQEAFGEKMGVSRQAISKWESDTAVPEVDRLIEMSKLFEVSVGWLLGTEGEIAPLPVVIPTPKMEPDAEICPPAPSPRWLRPAIAGAVALSLALSGVGLARSFRKIDIPPTPTQPDYSDTIAQMESDMIELEQQLSSQITQLTADKTLLENQCQSLERRLSQVQLRLPEDKENPTNPVGSLEAWSLTGTVDPSLTTASLIFSATSKVPTKGAQLSVISGAGENGQVTTVPCVSDGRSYLAQFQIPVANGYQYMLTITHNDGSLEPIPLTGHGLDNLTSDAQIQVAATPAFSGIGFHNESRFWIRWESISVSAPRLSDAESSYKWKDLRICYYHDGRLVTEISLKDCLSDEDWTSKTLRFQTPSHTYQMPSFNKGEQLTLMLEGTLSIDGVETEFSRPLIRWVVENQTLTIVES